MIIVLHGPSGSGKTLAGDHLKKRGIKELVSHTTRKKRPGEIHGEAYYFVDYNTFKDIEKIEESVYSTEHYGISKKEVMERDKSSWVFAVTDKNGVRSFQKIFKNEVIVIKIETTPRAMRNRMRDRGESKGTIRKRMKIYLFEKKSSDKIRSNFIIYNNSSIKSFFNTIDIVLIKSKNSKVNKSIEHKDYLQRKST